MKFALISQASAIKSYKCVGGKFYTLDDNPYIHHHSLSNECFMGFWNYPTLFDGYFLNLNDIENFPVIDFDVIMYANDTNTNISVNTIRDKFPNAIIISTITDLRRLVISLKAVYNWSIPDISSSSCCHTAH